MAGRNELCPCGSGKKYKKCCLSKDQERRSVQVLQPGIEIDDPDVDTQEIGADNPLKRRAPIDPELVHPEPAPPPDPQMEAINARWSEFEEASHSDRINIFLDTLNHPELMDDENAMGMLEMLYDAMVRADERGRFDELVQLLREKLPEIYDEGRKYYLGWLIENALANQRFDRVLEFAREIAETAGDNVDVYHWTVDQIAYHGQLTALAEASQIAWPLIKDSKDILWGQSEYAKWGADCVLFERLEKSPDVDVHDTELIKQVRYYYEELDVGRFVEYVGQLSGQANRSWTLSDIQKTSASKSKKAKRKSSDGQNPDAGSKKVDYDAAVDALLNEFVNYAHRQEGVPFTKVALARNGLIEYFFCRESGKLKPQLSIYESMLHPHKKPPKDPAPDHILCPDRPTLDRYIGGMFGMFGMRRHLAFATYELIPAWLRFLESRGLIDTRQREQTLADVGQLQPTLLELAMNSVSDPLPAENMKKWPEDPKAPVSV